MAVKLNLLPAGAGVTGGLAKFLKTTRMLGVIAIAFFLIFALGISAFFILSTVSLNGLNSDVNSLKGQITNLQSTETQIVLLKDRVSKIKTALAIPSAITNLDGINPFISNLPPSASLTQLNIDAQKVDLSISFSSTNDLSSFMNTISNTKNFSKVTMTSFGFNPSTGYLLSLILSNK